MHSSFGKKQSAQMRGVLPAGGQHLQIQSHTGQQKVQKNTSITPSQQQILLMNVLNMCLQQTSKLEYFIAD